MSVSQRDVQQSCYHGTQRPSGDAQLENRDEVDKNDQPSKDTTPIESKHFREVVFEENDPFNPKNLTTVRKWSIVLVLACGSLCVTMASSIYTTTFEQMDVEFRNSRIVATLGLSLFVFGLGLSPMLLGPLSEFYGRRPIYIIGFAMFLIWLVPCAVARNIETMLIARFLDGLSKFGSFNREELLPSKLSIQLVSNKS